MRPVGPVPSRNAAASRPHRSPSIAPLIASRPTGPGTAPRQRAWRTDPRAPLLRLLGALVILALPGMAAAQGLPSLPEAAAGGIADVIASGGGGGSLGLDGLAGGVGRNAALVVLLLTALSFAPGLAIAVTCFPFIVTVMSILRQSIGLPQSPPNMLIVVLSMFLTWFVMDPVLREAWDSAGRPLQAGEITLTEAFQRGIVPFRGFMEARTDAGTYDALAAVAPQGSEAPATVVEAPLSVLVPSFMLSEVQRAFEVGFLIALPFLIIDLVVSAVLMSMGMMMVPPAVVSLPFKLAFFVVVDGWGMVAGALVRSYQ